MVAGIFVGIPTAKAEYYEASIQLSEISPASVHPGERVTLTGTVTNKTAEDIQGVKMVIWGSNLRIESDQIFQNMLSSEPGTPVGTIPWTDKQATDLLGDGVLPAYGSKTFTVSANFTGYPSLGMTRAATNYLIGAQAVVGVHTIGWTRAFISYPPQTSPVDTTTVVLLSAKPSMLANGFVKPDNEEALFCDESLYTGLTGRLDNLLTLAEDGRASVIIDPALWDEVQAMAAGYRVQVDSADPVEGKGRSVATRWLERARAVIAAGGAYRSLYANPDLAAAQAAKATTVLGAAEAVLPLDHELAALPLAVVADSDSDVDQSLLTSIAAANPAVILANEPTGTDTVQLFNGTIPLVNIATDAFDGGVAPDPVATTVQVSQRLAAQRLLGNALGRPIVTLIRTGDQAAALADEPFPTTQVSLSELLQTGTKQAVTSSESASHVAPDPEFLSVIDLACSNLPVWGALANESEAAATMTNRLTALAWSRAWPSWRESMDWVNAVMTPFAANYGEGNVDLRVTPRWYLTAKDNQAPITITNNKQVPVSVQVRFSTENPQRIEVPDTDTVTIDPGETETVLVTPVANGNGIVSASALLTTSAGQALSDPIGFEISANSAGQIGWIIIVAAGAAFLLLTALRVRQVRRSRNRIFRSEPDIAASGEH
jgi:hypothetical protein